MPTEKIQTAMSASRRRFSYVSGFDTCRTSNGNMNAASVQAASKVAKSGVPVVRSTRVATGSVGRNVELNDDELGFIASDELNPQKARILLSLALLQPHTPDQLQQLFYMY